MAFPANGGPANGLSRKWGPPKFPLAPEGNLAEGGDWPDGLNRGRRQPVGWLLRARWHNWLVWAPRVGRGGGGLGCGKYCWRESSSSFPNPQRAKHSVLGTYSPTGEVLRATGCPHLLPAPGWSGLAGGPGLKRSGQRNRGRASAELPRQILLWNGAAQPNRCAPTVMGGDRSSPVFFN